MTSVDTESWFREMPDSLNVSDKKTLCNVKPLLLKETTLGLLLERSCSHCSGIYYDPFHLCKKATDIPTTAQTQGRLPSGPRCDPASLKMRHARFK